MYNNDEDNLNFLLTASPEVLLEWYNSVEADDIKYAFELLQAYQKRIDTFIEISKEIKVTYVDYGPLVQYMH